MIKHADYTDGVSMNRWANIVKTNKNSYFFDTPEWAIILKETYGYHIATRLYEQNDNKIIFPLMEGKLYGLKYYMSMPLGYGGLFSDLEIAPDDALRIYQDLLGYSHISLTLTLPPYYVFKEDAKIQQLNSEWNYTHMLSLEPGFDCIWEKKFNRKNRNIIRQAEKSEVEIRIGTSLSDYKKYYELYSLSSKLWGYSTPPYPIELYENLHKYGSEHVRLKLAVLDGITIGGLIDFSYGKNVFYWGSAFLKDYSSFHPSSLLLKDSIEQACINGYSMYNFGASGNLDGVRIFKESFGGEMVEIKRYVFWSTLGKIVKFVKDRCCAR